MQSTPLMSTNFDLSQIMPLSRTAWDSHFDTQIGLPTLFSKRKKLSF
jgi:hypothetical protein